MIETRFLKAGFSINVTLGLRHLCNSIAAL